MKTIKALAAAVLLVMFAMTAIAQADISAEKAEKIGKKNLKKLVDQSYHYRVEYDTIVVLPVHSKTVWKNDFYLLYFLKDDYFQVEMEIDRVTEEPAILAMGKMAPPYHETPNGKFNHRYFCNDSILHYSSIRRRLKQDSVRLVYFGVIPKLGKRGVIWETFSQEGSKYISLGGPQLGLDQLIRDMNTSQHNAGNYIADSIKMVEVMAEIDRIKSLSAEDRKALKIDEEKYGQLITELKERRKELIVKFPVLGRHFPLKD